MLIIIMIIILMLYLFQLKRKNLKKCFKTGLKVEYFTLTLQNFFKIALFEVLR